jgi:hypothetical protein
VNIDRRPRAGGDPVTFVSKTLDSRLRGNDGNRAVRLLAWALAIPAIALSCAAFAADTSSRVPLPTIAVDASTQCIEPPERMRRLHPELLRHQRDRTVRDGVRGARVSLNACIECHAGKGTGVAAGSVVGNAQAFCESCHRYAAVRLDCFECHQPRAGGALAAADKR